MKGKKIIIWLIMLLLVLTGFGPEESFQKQDSPKVIKGPTLIVRYDNNYLPTRIPPPDTSELGIENASFQINYNATTCGGGDPWPVEAQNAFDYAVQNIWGSLINASQTIVIDVCWQSLSGATLGRSGPFLAANTPNVPRLNTWYPMALINEFESLDYFPSSPEIVMQLNSTPPDPWYFGIDGQLQSGEIDFISVVLHEVGHGLGFSGSMTVSGGQGSWGVDDGQGNVYPMIYDNFTVNASGISLLNYPSPSSELAVFLTSAVYFTGSNAITANSGGWVPLYAPNPWVSGSSYSHLDESTYNPPSPNGLMTPILNNGQAIHDPGPVTMGIMQDIGWTINYNFSPDLQITKQVVGSGHQPGDPVTFTLSIQNNSAFTATTVVVTDTLSSDILTPDPDLAWSSTFSQNISRQSGTRFVWNLPDLSPDASGIITVTGTLNPALLPGFTILNTASVGAAETETNTYNNSSSAVIGTHYYYFPLIFRNYPSVEAQLINLINAERVSSGLAPLTTSSLLMQVAEAHSQDMRDRDFFSHTNPDGLGPGERLTNAGYNWWTYGETIGAGYTSAQAMFDGWMNSPGHRDILLGSSYTEIGIGYVTGGSWGRYWTAVFATPQ